MQTMDTTITSKRIPTSFVVLIALGAFALGRFSIMSWAPATTGEQHHKDAGSRNSFDPSPSIIKALQTQHPGCFSSSFHVNGRSTGRFLKQVGKYVNQTEPSAYDHSCFLMKARYNCARNTTQGKAAHEYKLILQHENGEICDLHGFVKTLGGMNGLGQLLLEQRSTNAVPSVLLMGNSMLRQIFESLACRFRDQITGNLFTLGGPAMTIATLRNRTELIDQDTELGAFFSLTNLEQQGCHGVGDKLADFFPEGVTVPPNNIADCSDNLGRIDFGRLQLYYVFRQTAYASTTALFEEMGLAPESLQAVVYNYLSAIKLNVVNNVTDVFEEDFRHRMDHPLYCPWNEGSGAYRSQQQEQLGLWFGAENPQTPFDKTHGCMPGPPDDAANLLLWSIVTKQPFNEDKK